MKEKYRFYLQNDMNWISVRVGTIIDKIELRNDKLNNIL